MRFSLAYSYQAAGDSRIASASLTAGWNASRWLFFQCSASQLEAKYDMPAPARDVYANGPGDFSLAVAVNLSVLVFGMKPTERQIKFEQMNGDFPHFGLGYKLTLPTGETDDQTPGGGVNLPEFQPGTGTVDQTFYAGYHQVMDRFMPFFALSYVVAGPRNSDGYERADKLNFSGGCSYSIDNMGEYGVQIMLTSSTVLDNDFVYDGGGERELETAGTSLTGQIAFTWRPAENVDLSLSLDLPITEAVEDSTMATDYVVGFSASFRF